MIQVYTDRQHLIERLSLKSLSQDFNVVYDAKELNMKEIIVSDPDTARTLLKTLPYAKIMVLSDAPSFAEGSKLLPLGIRGYANSYIHLKHLMQAIITIENGSVWLYPAFMQQLINGAASSTTKQEQALEKLTERERDTALLVKEGLSNKEIASRLDITERTVKQHLSNIFEKLDVSDRLSLALLLK